MLQRTFLLIMIAALWAAPTRAQTGVSGRYILRSVNGAGLPATIPGDDPKHKTVITSGVLDLRPDGRYVCRTSGQSVYLHLIEPFSDSVAGTYNTLLSGAISFNLKGARADTIKTSGFQIAWTHPVRTVYGRFLYSR
jgi:hypothetical protein